MPYEIRFTAYDMYHHFKKLRDSQREGNKEAFIDFSHQFSNLNAPLFARLTTYVDDGLFGKLRKGVPNSEQLQMVQRLRTCVRFMHYTIGDLAELFSSNTDDKEIDVKSLSLEYLFLAAAKNAVAMLPIADEVRKIGDLTSSDKWTLDRLDANFDSFFYSLNLEFSPDRKMSAYRLDLDVKNSLEFLSQKGITEAPKLVAVPELPYIETKVDYFQKVLVSLVQNVDQHAFDSQNDLEGRLRKPDFKRKYEISGKADEKNSEIVINVRDFGFGISPDLVDRIFQEGATTKSDTTNPHGIGLWLVKKFVEENNGRMWFETKQGEGTSFYFTIPYREKIGKIRALYKQ